MPTSTENIRRWIEQSDIDYITNFIKAWIPFNAWYNASYPTLDSDRKKINKIKKDSNPVRNAINSYMESDSQEGLEFRSYLSSLHFNLQNSHLENSEGVISFNSIIKEKNPKNLIDNEIIGHNKYYLRRVDAGPLGEISEIQIFLKRKNDNTTIFSYRHDTYDLNHLQAQQAYIALSYPRKEQLRLYFKQLEPIIVTDLVQYTLIESPKNYYKCDSYNFIRDINNTNCYAIFVCKGLIETLYQLRNILFHGELIPNVATQKVYKEAYALLKLILDKIR
ncbi:hypothetical protein KJK34_13975 [Flavobacterium sp. D11R37]|uniref:hypothetical protein n=1 Tax=Flavobacterium coralii TaxID=2838017 RepID=UPI001CA75761|nr:hypothetical protein [Flavobacterium coralii]MBY8963864.1 hypothetical protein [Flavobacterium coralii]